MWDHAAWLDFVAKAREQGLHIPEEMHAYLGEVLEAMKRFYTATASTQGIEKAMTDIAKDSAGFITEQKGAWGHIEWEAFAKRVQENTMHLSDEATSYLGGIVESMKALYSVSPVSKVVKKVSETTGAKIGKKSATKPATNTGTKTAAGKDDLTAISGVGPALQKKLNASGIHSYAQIAALTDADIDRLEQDIIKFSGRIRREDWVGQARALEQRSE